MRSQYQLTSPRPADEEVTSATRSGEFGSWSGLTSSPRRTVGIREQLYARDNGWRMSVRRENSVCSRSQASVTQTILHVECLDSIIELALEVFVQNMGSCWDLEGHHIGPVKAVEAVVEPVGEG